MKLDIDTSWKIVLAEEFDKPYFHDLIALISDEYVQNTCYPPQFQIFSAFNSCPFHKVKVVILGQDPYHGEGQANGLSFSVNDGVAYPPSLRNIFEEIRKETGNPVPASGNLERWVSQGVLLLNAVLTVRKGEPGSHQNSGWEIFSNAVVKKISAEKANVVFMLWGGYAKKKGAVVDQEKHLVLTSGHPSPLSANRGHWFGNNHFILANKYLKETGQKEVEW